MATAHTALNHAIAYVRERVAFGQPIASFQNTKFVLADCATDIEAAQALVDRGLELDDAGELSAADAAKIKLHTTEMAGRVSVRLAESDFGGIKAIVVVSNVLLDSEIGTAHSDSSNTSPGGPGIPMRT